ncbi:MAG: membrane protein insertase YidC [Vicinamibacterales bacterium]
MERRVLLAIFLSFLVLYAYQTFFPSTPPKPSPESAASGAAPGGAAATASPVVPSPDTEPVAARVGDTSEREVRVESPTLVATFTNRGGRLKSLRLKQYLDRTGDPLELVDQSIAGKHPLPFSLRVDDAAVTAQLNAALYTVQEQKDGEAPGVVFAYESESGLSVRKAFTLDPTSYVIGVDVSGSRNGQTLTPTVLWGPGLGDSDSDTGRAVKPEGLFASGGKVTRLDAGDVASQSTYQQDFDYAGIDDHYFAAFALDPGAATVTYEAVQVPHPQKPDTVRNLMAFSITPAPAERTLRFYAGPKNFETLAAIDRNLVKAINFGMFSVIVVPLLRSLNWIHGYIGNYGWAIFILTILINLVLFPLNHKSVVSMRKMQEVQPQAKAIQERYSKLKATDPARQKMNQEMMALYREHGVNPASGCIPILLTLPVFLAFYALLTTAIELRGAPFIGWIHDLSAPDPYYVMPILVGASQILTQWLTPQAGADPAQQKMMMIMPVVLIFVFVSTPAGALIYWFVGNVWRLGQMQVTNYIHPPKVRVVRPAAERRVKRVGGGKTENAARES